MMKPLGAKSLLNWVHFLAMGKSCFFLVFCSPQDLNFSAFFRLIRYEQETFLLKCTSSVEFIRWNSLQLLEQLVSWTVEPFYIPQKKGHYKWVFRLHWKEMHGYRYIMISCVCIVTRYLLYAACLQGMFAFVRTWRKPETEVKNVKCNDVCGLHPGREN